MRRIWVLTLLLVACGVGRRAERPEAAPPDRVSVPTPAPAQGLYGAEEALRDALATPLQHVGTGTWPGIRRMFACAFQNDRVLVVSVYCSPTDRQALRVVIYSPQRGRVSIYAEAKGGVSSRQRADYFTFMVESEPSDRALSLPLAFEALRAYEEQRSAAYPAQCYGGQELSTPRGGCLGALAPQSAAFTRQNGRFLERASDDWYRLVRDLRVLAVHHGREPS
ncbi:MAG TPA: hypothetical protein VFX59_18805 [Polyangiales bacterium]|nr:hypothetical protein [Polyangiales bacterium]